MRLAGAAHRRGTSRSSADQVGQPARLFVGAEHDLTIAEHFTSFGADIPAISGTKSLTGHSLGATGVQAAIYCILMMKNNFICESANIEELDPEFADIPIVRKRIDNAKIDVVMSNSFGFGGTNATLVFKRHDS